MSNTHYRKVFKSDHLGVADLEDLIESGKSLIFEISHVKQEFNVSVAGRKGNFNIAYFKQNIKPLVLNATNSKVVRSFNGNSPFVEDWKNTLVELFIQEKVRAVSGGTTEGVRIRPKQPIINKVKPIFTEENFEKAKSASASIKQIKSVYTIDSETEKKYLDYVAKK